MTSRLAWNHRLVLMMAAAMTLAACSQQAPTSASAPTADAPVAAAATQAAATTATTATAAAAADGASPVLGSDYVEIPGGQPFMPAAGKIEVAEVFSYTCPHCAEFEPLVNAWRGTQPADVNFVSVAAPYGGNPLPFARAFYAAETMGLLGKTHDAMFRAIHRDHSLPVMGVSDAQIADFYAGYGANPKQFASTMASFAVDAKVKRAMQFAEQSGVDGTPALVVDGKYRVLGKSFEDMLRIAGLLVAQENAARP